MCLLGLLLLPLTGCSRETQFVEDLFEEHYAFLRYSLGDFEVLGEGVWNDSFPGQSASGREWHLQFTRQNGGQERFSFRNGGHGAFGRAFTGWVERYGVQQLEALAQEYFTQEDFQHHYDGGYSRVSIIMYFQRDNPRRGDLDYAPILDHENGLRLYSITLSEMIDWGFTFRIVVSSSDHENYLDVIERLKAMTRALAAHSGQEQIEVRFNLLPGEKASRDYSNATSFTGYYYSQTDIFEIATPPET